MPIYEYRCDECGEIFDKFFRSMSRVGKEAVVCPQCESEAVQRLISAPAVHSGESGDGQAAAEAAADSASDKPPVFGRKELNKAIEKKHRLREEAKYSA